MGYGLAWYGLSWYGLCNYFRSSSQQVKATVAERRPLSLPTTGNVAHLRASPIPIVVHISPGRLDTMIPAKGRVIGRRDSSLGAGGVVAAKNYASIGAWAWIATQIQHAIQAGGRVSTPGLASVPAICRITGTSSYGIHASGSISLRETRALPAGGRISDFRSSIYAYAFGKIAIPRSTGIATRTHICGRARISIPVRGAVALARVWSIAACGGVGEPHIINISCTGRVSAPGHNNIQARGLVARGGNRAGVNVRGAVTRPQHRSLTVGGLVILSPYYSLNNWDLTGQILEGLKASGPEPKFERISFRGRMDARLVDQGYSPMEYSFEVHFPKIEEAFDYVKQMQDPGDGRFFPGDSMYFHKVRAISTERVKRRGRHMFVIKTTVYLEKPYLYSILTSEWELNQVSLPRTSGDIINRGHIDMPPELVRIVGRYNSAYVKGLRLSIMDGVTEDSYLLLSDRLLSDEILELDEDGRLTSTYYDDYSSCTRFNRDTIRSNASCSGKVTIGNDGYVVYDLRGAWPLMENMRLTATLRVLEGAPVVEVSTDGGATYTPVVSQIRSGVRGTYYLTDTVGHRNVLVRFQCGSSDSLEINDVEFVGVRRVSASMLPKIAAGSTRQIRITDDPDSGHLVDLFVRFREARLPV